MTNKVIKITNTSNGVSRLALEKLGLSTKRNDPDTIGQFGSGIKYAPIAAIRMGLEWYFTGSDSKGDYTLYYDVQVEDGIKCIVYDYGDYKKPSSFTIDAGILSWEDEFQIYREAIANAIDEASLNGGEWTRSIVFESEIVPTKGEFSVYITASPAMMEIYNDHDKHFLGNRKCIYDSPNVKFYDPYNSKMNVYSKTVRVLTNDNNQGELAIFDYEMPRIKLNEMRTVADLWGMQYNIAEAIADCNETKVIEKFLKASDDGLAAYEFNYISTGQVTHCRVNKQWLKTWEEQFGEDCVMLTSSENLNPSIRSFIKEKKLKYRAQNNDMLYTILSRAGVKSIQDIAGDAIEYDIDTDIKKYPKLIKAIKIASRFEPNLLNIKNPIAVFTSASDTTLGICIKTSDQTRQILIEKNHALNGELNELVATIIHEYDHYESGCVDGDLASRKFRDLADRRIGKLMCDNYDAALITVTNKSISVTIEDLSEVGGINYIINKAPTINGYMVKIGKINFAIEDFEIDNFQNVSGTMETSEAGNSFHINYTSSSQNPKVTVI